MNTFSLEAPTLPSLNCNGRLVDLSKPKIMGILNVTPDSFSDGGRFFSESEALKHAEKLIEEGADILDIGAQSTRPNAEKIDADEERKRLGQVIAMIKKEFPTILVSVDTFYSEVVRFGYDQGMDLVNDISGGQFDDAMLSTVAELKLPYVLMHINSTYKTMHEKEIQGDVLVEINRYFSEKLQVLKQLGINDVVLDPGFGFGKTVEQQHYLLDNCEHIGFGRFPLLIGISRKSFIYKPLGKQPIEIDDITQELHRKVLEKGAKILRVHDVASTKKTIEKFLHEVD